MSWLFKKKVKFPKIICPNCGAKEGQNDPDFGFPPCCIGEIGKHVTCYSCNHVFEFNYNAVKNNQ